MSVLLYALGALCVVCGAAAIVFGIPVKEFSFGDTLIGSGVTGVVGGLILIGLGAAVAQLQRIAEFLGARPLARAGQPGEPAVRLGPSTGRVPFPPKPKAEPRDRPADMPIPVPVTPRADRKSNEPEFGGAPSLHNPDVPLMAEEEAEELPLSPRAERHASSEPEAKTSPERDTFARNWRSSPSAPPRPSQPDYFENMWPAAERNPPPAPEEPAPSRAESIPRVPEMDEVEPVAEESREEDVTPVAVLKSGVVDGMGYTLYVDGSIEAELPDGTLRFASINELRAHLEKNS
jgi:hypothetical protein